jgi:hypothetical protein
MSQISEYTFLFWYSSQNTLQENWSLATNQIVATQKSLLMTPLMRREKMKIKNKKLISGDNIVVAIDPSSAATL